jgi:phosphomannomutase
MDSETTDPASVAQKWIAGDPDEQTRAELQALVDAGAEDELRERMAGTLEFGTAGIRGRVEAGSNRMNRAVVIRTTRGLADYLLATTDADRGPVVVGRDARPSSPTFLEDAVSVLAAAGFSVMYLDEPMPTPVIAFATKELGACAGIVITASHNPPDDNGYKVYDGRGVQIVPPVDRHIADAIAQVGPANDVPRVDAAFGHPMVGLLREDLRDRYFAEVAQSIPGVTGTRSISIVYTAMHGVGGRFVAMVLDRFGFRNVHPVASQFEPDGRFPTVSFPNPEEPGALDLAHDLASSLDADLVLANDPDADRLAVSLPDGAGGWRPLTGNQIGVLLADWLLEHRATAEPLIINSIVSSPMLAAIAAGHEAGYARTLTGFKWIWNAALDLEEAGKGEFVFGYEEALGYSVGQTVRDKDGISAALAFAVLTAAAVQDGATVWDRLEALYRRHGLWVSIQKSMVRLGTEGAEELAGAMASLASEQPTELGGVPVTGVTDYRRGAEDRPRWLPATPLVEFALGDTGRALIRPSGTEPKLKIYVDLRADLPIDAERIEREAALTTLATAVADDLARFLGFS